MGIDPRKYVRPGDPIKVAANQINGVNELLRRSQSPPPPPAPREKPYTWCHARNAGGQTINRGSVAHVTGLAQNVFSDSGLASYYDTPCLTVVGFDNRNGLFEFDRATGVAVEPIAANAIGRIAVSGLVQALVDVVDLKHRFAFVSHRNSTVMTSGFSGGHTILYKPPYLGVQNCLVQLGSPSVETIVCVRGYGASWPRRTVQPVTVYPDNALDDSVLAYNPFFDMPPGTTSGYFGRLVLCSPLRSPLIELNDVGFVVVAWEE